MMLLFPLWVALISVPCIYAAARYTRSGLAALAVSLCFLISGTVVLLSFSHFSGNVSIAHFNGLLLLNVRRVAVLSSLVFMGCSVPFLIYYLPGVAEDRLPRAAAMIHLLIVSALCSFFAADLLSFAVAFEAVPLCAFALVVTDGNGKCSPYQHLLYLVPFVLLLLVIGLTAESMRNLGNVSAIAFPSGATLLLAAVFAARLLFFPFGQPALNCLRSVQSSGVSYALFSLPSVALVGLLKFSPQARLLGEIVMMLAALSMVVWALFCYRDSRTEDRTEAGTFKVTLHAYLAQTAVVTVMVLYPILNGGLESCAFLLILGSHFVSSLGALLCVSLSQDRRGRLGNVALIFFIFCMLGLPPSPGFFGRLMLFKTSLAVQDFPSYVLRLSFLANLFVVYCQSRQLAPVIEGTKSGSKSSRRLGPALALLTAYLLAGMLFLARLRDYLATSRP